MANERARTFRSNPTDAERAIWRKLRELKHEGFHFRRQAPIGRYIVDFACHTAKVIVEIDGGQHNDDRAIASDERRTGWLNGRGYNVVRFWNNEVLRNMDGVMFAIRDALDSAQAVHPTPNPSPSRGGETKARK